MICPDCQAEYLDNINECGDCKVTLIDACALDLPIPEMTWIPLPTFIGSTYADMIIEILNQKEIPHYVKSNWSSSALSTRGSGLIDDVIRVFVPKQYEQKATNIVNDITGGKK
ncbi:MAG: hypothetical protein NZ735_05060 [Candidatus Marinimicrobia bacterium]|jgi:hypothetical protein|nr:hypothetical protein [Candidatus Neomarinimicrobiota bacterium]MEE3152961.1 hypothetical protein [Candidatus Neomarinimicrobiota bacterium]|tara:strand:- start:2047 stop:2385 length:339 start_codon:yes stop_codon:yes gene_type:complete